MNKKIYLGDSVHAEFDGTDIKLITQDNENSIYLGLGAMSELINFTDKIFKMIEKESK